MNKNKVDQIKFIIEIIKSMHYKQIAEFTQKFKNIEHLNIESLIDRIETEIPVNEWENNYDKIVSIIEDIIRD